MRDEIFGSKVNNKNKVSVIFVLDETGSMSPIRNEVIISVNNYIESLQKDKAVEYLFTMILFNSVKNEAKYSNAPIADVKKFTDEDYQPNGMTPLYDAIGKAIHEPKIGDRFIVTIMTDGQENFSKEYSLEGIRKAISEKDVLDNWTFVFLGAGIDAWAGASLIGINPQNAIQFDPNQIGVTMSSYSNMTRSYAAMNPDCFQEEKTKASIFFKDKK